MIVVLKPSVSEDEILRIEKSIKELVKSRLIQRLIN